MVEAAGFWDLLFSVDFLMSKGFRFLRGRRFPGFSALVNSVSKLWFEAIPLFRFGRQFAEFLPLVNSVSKLWFEQFRWLVLIRIKIREKSLNHVGKVNDKAKVPKLNLLFPICDPFHYQCQLRLLFWYQIIVTSVYSIPTVKVLCPISRSVCRRIGK